MSTPEKVTISTIDRIADTGEPVTMLTAYDAPTARAVDDSGVHVVLVGDTAASNHHGYDSTLPLTLEEALSNTAAVVRGVERALVVGDMPFASYGHDVAESVKNAQRFLDDAGADAVKFETAPDGGITIDIADRLTTLGVPVVGHLGLTPQRTNQLGGPKIQGRDGPDTAFADTLVDTAQDLEAAGAFAIVLEGVAEALAKRITDAVDVPTIGIGAGRYTDGQVLVTTDVLGVQPSGYKLSKQYANLDGEMREALSSFIDDVESGAFPAREHVYEPLNDDN
jgi:3-methyl-2-oxobutanoate hydroxymethyltransferase